MMLNFYYTFSATDILDIIQMGIFSGHYGEILTTQCQNCVSQIVV